VAYRIKRIEEITGLKLDNYRDRLIAQVALEILDALPEPATPTESTREH
jgi:DNA-binding PucR family transcriptional regulator